MGKIGKNNLVVIGIVILIYVLIDYLIYGSDLLAFLQVFLIQMGFIALAVSPVGEAILRLIYGGRAIKTEKDYESIVPLFNAVYDDVLKLHPNTNKNISVFIDDDMSINAYALGSRTVTVTRGAIQTLTEDELKSIIAHEFGHLSRGDTLLPLIILVGNGMYLFFLAIIKLVQLMIVFASGITGLSLIGDIVNILINLLLTLALFIVQAILLINDRQNEYYADEFAHTLGYGYSLTEALYKIANYDMSGKLSLLDKIKSSHPNIHERIGRLESLEG